MSSSSVHSHFTSIKKKKKLEVIPENLELSFEPFSDWKSSKPAKSEKSFVDDFGGFYKSDKVLSLVDPTAAKGSSNQGNFFVPLDTCKDGSFCFAF
jgi:hypothetical protein